MTLTVICPTRGRPQSAAQLSEAFQQTAVVADLLFAIDLDDPCLSGYDQALADSPCTIALAPRQRMGPTLNNCARVSAAADPHGVVGFMGDDHRPRSYGWDAEVLDALAGAPGVAYGDDLVHGPNLPTAVFVSASLINRLGYMAPPGLIHLYLDNFWLELGRATRLIYLPHLVFEHLHPIAGKADWDAGYLEANSNDEYDRAEFDRYLRYDWPAERLKVAHGG